MATEVPRMPGAASRPRYASGRPLTANSWSRPLRFLLCGDLRLGEVCQPVSGIDPTIEQRLITAPYAAATKVFDLAVLEQVDFVVLIGTHFSPAACGVQEPAFLASQFERLNQHQIPVIWARPASESEVALPDWISRPGNVVELDPNARQRFVFTHDDGPAASVTCLPTLQAATDDNESPRIGVIPGSGDLSNATLEGTGCDVIVAAGGLWTASDQLDHSIPAEFSQGIGPQGRSFDEYGPHGCWIVSLESHRRSQVDFVPCDIIRWRREIVDIDDDTTWDDLLTVCELQSRRAASSCHAATLIKWQILGHGPLSRELWEASRMQTLVQALRDALLVERSNEGRVAIAVVELVFDPKEEARLRSERSSWAAWSSAIDDLRTDSATPWLDEFDSQLDLPLRPERGADRGVRVPHFQKLRREALHKLIRRVGSE